MILRTQWKLLCLDYIVPWNVWPNSSLNSDVGKVPRSVWLMGRDITQRASMFSQSVELILHHVCNRWNLSSIYCLLMVDSHSMSRAGVLTVQAHALRQYYSCWVTCMVILLVHVFFKKVWSLQPVFVTRHNINIYFCLYRRKNHII